MQSSDWNLLSQDNISLHGRDWTNGASPKGVICLVHGLGEHLGRYEHVARFFTEAGYAMTALDLRGHGQSQGPRGHMPSYEHLMADISAFLERAGRTFPRLPRFLYGHSLGGTLVLNHALRVKPDIKGVICTGPWLRLAFEPSAGKVALAKLMSKISPEFSQANGLELPALSRDAHVVQAYQDDPLVHDRISARLFVETHATGAWVLQHAADFLLPLLLMHGAADRVTSCSASREFAAQNPEKITFKAWDGLYHEIHNEPEQLEVFKFILAWLAEIDRA